MYDASASDGMSAVHKRGHHPPSLFHVFVNAFARCRTPAYPAHPDGPMQTHEVLLQILSAGEDGSIKSHSCGPISYSAASRCCRGIKRGYNERRELGPSDSVVWRRYDPSWAPVALKCSGTMEGAKAAIRAIVQSVPERIPPTQLMPAASCSFFSPPSL